jgi:hypothetical protein
VGLVRGAIHLSLKKIAKKCYFIWASGLKHTRPEGRKQAEIIQAQYWTSDRSSSPDLTIPHFLSAAIAGTGSTRAVVHSCSHPKDRPSLTFVSVPAPTAIEWRFI